MKTIFSIIFATAIGVSPAMAQGLFDNVTSQPEGQEKKSKFEVNGYARGLAYGAGEDYDLATAFGELALKGKLANQKAFLFADVRLREGVFFDNRAFQLQLKEAYAGYRGDKLDLYLGNQIVAWGRTDGFNPTNTITPNDYFFLSYEPDDQKLANFMFRAKIKPFDYMDIDLVAIPFYLPSNYRYDLFKSDNPAVFYPIQLPSVQLEKGSLGVRFNLEHPVIGVSLSYFQGYNPFYGFNIESFNLNPMQINYRPTPYFMRNLGADFAKPLGSWIVRGEMAYSITKNYQRDMHIPNPDFSYVLGLERSFFGTTTILQYIGKYTVDFKELATPLLSGFTPEAMMKYAADMIAYESEQYNRKIFNQHEQTNHMLFLSLNRSFYYDQVNVELTGMYNITNKEQLVRGRVKWSLTDAVAANVGCSYMFGDDKFLYHMAGKVMNGVFVGLEVGF